VYGWQLETAAFQHTNQNLILLKYGLNEIGTGSFSRLVLMFVVTLKAP
jgi:hypothetical protein